MEMAIFLAAGDVFSIDSAPCAVTQFRAKMHKTGFMLGHSHIYKVDLVVV